MSQIASKNLYELLGNDPELDPDREPEPPTKAIDKPVQRAGKRNAGADGPARDAPRPAGGARGGRQEGPTRPDQAGPLNTRAEQREDGARNDRNANRSKDPRDYRESGNRPRGQRGGRGYVGRGGGRPPRDDRHSHSGRSEHEKQAAHGWGNEQDGAAEWTDEKAGEAIAKAEAKNESGLTPDVGSADPAFTDGPNEAGEDDVAAEAEDKTKSYDQYLADLAEKRMALSGENLEIRKANEGSKQKFPTGKAYVREAEDFFVGGGNKQRKEKEGGPKKEMLTLEGQYYAPAEQDRGGRGRGRGGRGSGFRGDRGDRGGERGDRSERGDRGDRSERGDRGDRGRGRGRGEFRGGRGEHRGDRGGRGGERGSPRTGFNASDNASFPALGS